MALRGTLIALWTAAIIASWANSSFAGDLIFGCRSRPACGKVCKLVCDTETLAAVGYGCECDTICIPGPSRQGCKHYAVTCCRDSVDEGCSPKIEFCWRDWFACGCAKPRTVKVLTKYVAEKEVCSYHWEVVDACRCSCPVDGCGCSGEPNCPCVYKPAPPEAQLGDVSVVTPQERVQLASLVPRDANDIAVSLAAADNEVTCSQPPTADAPELVPLASQARPSPRNRLATALGTSAK